MSECLCGSDYVERLSEQCLQLNAKIRRLQHEVRHCRNELCLKCGNYHQSYAGACDGCRFKRGGEWEADLNDQDPR